MSTERRNQKHLTASALIENAGEFLLIWHGKLGLWLYPGGHVEADEEPQDAMLREVMEEVGLPTAAVFFAAHPGEALPLGTEQVVELPAPLAVLRERIAARRDEPEHWHINLVYLCRISGAARTSLAPSRNLQWATPEAAEDLACPPELPSLMRRALQSGRLARQS